MTPDSALSSQTRGPKVRQYPIRCAECGAKEIRPAVISYVAQKSHDGRVHTLEIPDLKVLRCGSCGEILFDLDADAQISAALRARLSFLTPEQIRANIGALGLTQKGFAGRLGVAAESG